MKGKALRKHSLHEKTAASSNLSHLKLFGYLGHFGVLVNLVLLQHNRAKTIHGIRK